MLTVLENVRVAAQSRKTTFNLWSKALSHKDLLDQSLSILELIGLADFKDETAANLSHGDRKRLEIGIALATRPKLLLLDEPTAGLSPPETRQTIELIKKISEGLTIILVEHKMKVVMEVSSKVTVLYYGSLLVQGTPDEIRNNEEVKRVYLGGYVNERGHYAAASRKYQYLLRIKSCAPGGLPGGRQPGNRHPGGPQRRRQNHHLKEHPGDHPHSLRTDPFPGSGYQRPADPHHRPKRHLLCPGGKADHPRPFG